MFELPQLPYELYALEPYISRGTMEFHYLKHHRTYVDNLNKLIEGTPFENMDLEKLIVNTYGKSEYLSIFNNAAQVWNHSFFWQSMEPDGGTIPVGELSERIERDFGSYDKFKSEFKQAAISQFGSGWAWLIEDEKGKLSVIKTSNADTPIAHGYKPIITCDVWEHAYYLDYQNRRADFLDSFLSHLVKWK